ncbi:MAG: cupin-like domain-containing protein [Reyranellaceae bacterium]
MKDGTSQPVPVLERERLWRFADAYARVGPVVLRGAVAAGLLRYWEPAVLRSRAGSVPVTVNLRRDQFDFESWRVEHQRDPARSRLMMNLQQMPLAAVLDEVFDPAHDGPRRDIAIAGLECSTLGGHAWSRDLCPLAVELGCDRPHLWASGARRRHQAHFDPGDVFILMVCGLKRFSIAPPSATSGLYPYPGHAALSRIPDLLHADIVKWPLFDPARLWTTELRPREVLYIPQLWWHQSDYLAPSLSLSLWP